MSSNIDILSQFLVISCKSCTNLLQILQFIRTFEAQYPVGNRGRYIIWLQIGMKLICYHFWNIIINPDCRQSVGGLYYLSYLDNNILLGRAVGGGGVFVFTRAHTLVWLLRNCYMFYFHVTQMNTIIWYDRTISL